jgi:hypothetical protein
MTYDQIRAMQALTDIINERHAHQRKLDNYYRSEEAELTFNFAEMRQRWVTNRHMRFCKIGPAQDQESQHEWRAYFADLRKQMNADYMPLKVAGFSGAQFGISTLSDTKKQPNPFHAARKAATEVKPLAKPLKRGEIENKQPFVLVRLSNGLFQAAEMENPLSSTAMHISLAGKITWHTLASDVPMSDVDGIAFWLPVHAFRWLTLEKGTFAVSVEAYADYDKLAYRMILTTPDGTARARLIMTPAQI